MKEFFTIETPYSSEEYKIMDKACKNRSDFPLSKFIKSPHFVNKFRWDIHNSELPTLYNKLEKMYEETQNYDILSWLEDIQKIASKYEPGPQEPVEPDFSLNEDYDDNCEVEETLNIEEENITQKTAMERFVDMITGGKEIEESGSENLANLHGTNLKPSTLDENTDTERYEDVVFLQGDGAEETMEILNTLGKDAALTHLMQWHYPGEHMGSNEESHGSNDKTYRKDGYIMSWNTHIPYIGLQYDTTHTVNEDSHILRRIAGQRGKKSPLGKHGPRSQNAK
jgi:hypothetical protein